MIFQKLSLLHEIAESEKSCGWLDKENFCIADANLAQAILRNSDKFFEEHSDFFFAASRNFSSRAAQIKLAREVRSHLADAWAATDIGSIVAAIPECSLWPGAGCALLYQIFGRALLAPWRSADIRKAVHAIIDARMIGRTDSGEGGIRSYWRRHRLLKAIGRQRTVEAPAPHEHDVLSIVARRMHASSNEMVAEIFLGFVFSSVNSLGVSLSWLVLLAVDNKMMAAPPRRLALEALRMFPISWMMERRPTISQYILGHLVNTDHIIVVSPYAVHRNPRHWAMPNQFQPGRWSKPMQHRGGWMPFGAGPHSCVAMQLNLEILTALAAAIAARGQWTIEASDRDVLLGPALTPSPFRLVRR